MGPTHFTMKTGQGSLCDFYLTQSTRLTEAEGGQNQVICPNKQAKFKGKIEKHLGQTYKRIIPKEKGSNKDIQGNMMNWQLNRVGHQLKYPGK